MLQRHRFPSCNILQLRDMYHQRCCRMRQCHILPSCIGFQLEAKLVPALVQALLQLLVETLVQVLVQASVQALVRKQCQLP